MFFTSETEGAQKLVTLVLCPLEDIVDMLDDDGRMELCQLCCDAVCILFECAYLHKTNPIVVNQKRTELALLAFFVGY